MLKSLPMFSYSTVGGMSRSEAGVVTAEGGYSVTGSYQYRGPDGATYRVDFTADQRGYRPRYGIQLYNKVREDFTITLR